MALYRYDEDEWWPVITLHKDGDADSRYAYGPIEVPDELAERLATTMAAFDQANKEVSEIIWDYEEAAAKAKKKAKR